jgi:poly-beta-hydroxyalkanoate depolymerase
MTIHNDITIQAPWKSREFDMVLQYFLQLPCFLSLNQVELVATASWYFNQVWVIPKWTS